jgi:hypothetical protein
MQQGSAIVAIAGASLTCFLLLLHCSGKFFAGTDSAPHAQDKKEVLAHPKVLR